MTAPSFYMDIICMGWIGRTEAFFRGDYIKGPIFYALFRRFLRSDTLTSREKRWYDILRHIIRLWMV